MKSQIFTKLGSRLRITGPHRRKGVAILTVLAIITLMTVLVISFFNMATTAQTTAKGSVEIQRVTTLKDTIINIVVAQFREASALAPKDASKPRELVTWTSQPGAIRTFSATDPSRTKLFKLYSSSEPQIMDIAMNSTGRLLDDLNKDLVSDWAQRPDEWTDLNRPVYTAATGDRAQATGATDAQGYTYPIADPRRYNGGSSRADRLKNTEGFVYSSVSRGKRIQGVDPKEEQLAMPVRWIYLLQDGTLGYLNESQEFTSLNGASGGEISRTNPIVGRLAWWADDESSKVNVNTASVPFVWDTPRTSSQEDVLLGQRQPIAGEFQRYPGHPATVDLSAVFHPGRRWTPYPGIVPPGGDMETLDLKDAERIWNVAPFIVGENSELRSGGSLGTIGGSVATPVATNAAVGASTDDRIFTSLDEMYFKAVGASGLGLNQPRQNLGSLGSDSQGEFLATLEKSQFFLTHKSHSPETTSHGYPRVSMYPMDVRAASEVGRPANATVTTGVSPYDVTVAVNTTIARRPYYFQREVTQAGSRHLEIFQNSGGRNGVLFKYLKELSKLPIPGYPDAVPYDLSPALSSVDEPTDARGLSFASKYPQSWRTGTQRYLNSNRAGADPMDATDRTQILFNMLDYTRSINTNSAFLGNEKYDGGKGQASAICGCRGIAGSHGPDHAAFLSYTENTYRAPKGTGKRHGVAEIVMIVNVAAKKNPDGTADGNWGPLAGMLDTKSATLANATEGVPGTRYIVEVGFFASGFSPKHGWSAQYPSGGIAISGLAGNGDDPRTAATRDTTTDLPLYVQVGEETEKLSIFRGEAPAGLGGGSDYASGTTESRLLPPGVVPMGGYNGARSLFTRSNEGNSIAICRPFCISVPGGASSFDPGIRSTGGPMRIMLYDGGAGSSNVITAIDLNIPLDFTTGMMPSYSPVGGGSLRRLAREWGGLTQTNMAAKFPPPAASLRSFVVPHGDYRLTVTPHKVERDIFVPQVNTMAGPGVAVGGNRAHSLFEGHSDPRQSSFVADAPPGTNSGQQAYSLIGSIMDRVLVPQFPSPRNTSTNILFPAIPFGMAHSTQIKASAAMLDPGRSPTSPWVRLASLNDTLDPSEGVSRRELFSHGRRDGHGVVPNRGSSDPTETSDFDNGIGTQPDGPYMNYPDEGDRRNVARPYFDRLADNVATGIPAARISPNFLVRSPVDFGSIPTGIQTRVPWQTLRFRPDPYMNNPAWKMRNSNSEPPPGLPFANFCGPKDHFFLDMFWMPVVEPWAISEPFSTKGTINLNQQILPFQYIQRTTALHALLRGERMLAIPNAAGDVYKDNPQNNTDTTYRYFVNAKETIRQFTRRYEEGKDAEGFEMAFNVFRSASEICELWLVPDKNLNNRYDNAEPEDWTLEYVSRRRGINGNLAGFWDNRLLTGDNSRERPYANLYPRVTVRSNVFKLHLVAQTLQKATSTDPKSFDSVVDLVTAEWRGSCMIERSINPNDPALTNIDYTNLNAASLNPNTTPKLDRFYTYRVTEVKQLTQ